MPRNIGIVDQVVRALLGLAILAYLFKDGLYTSGLGLGGLLGAYLMGTATLQYCPLYGWLGFSTYGRLDRSA
jgi:Protein of unknown function (DUF2892)